MPGEEEVDYMGDVSQFLQHQVATLRAKEKKEKERKEKEKRDKEKKDKEYKRKLKWKEKCKIKKEEHQKEKKLNGKEKRNFKREKQGKKEKLNWEEMRKIKIEKQQKEEEEQITKGSSSAIPSTNIGFKMLQQMGYNPGLALGKHGQGRLEPIGIEIKRSRTGLGRDDLEKEIEKEKEIRRAKEIEKYTQKNRMNEQDMMSEFRENRKQLWQSRKITSSYKKASATLAQLEEADSRPDRDDKEKKQEEDVDEAIEDEEEEEEEEEEVVTAEDLQEVLNRLRIEFNYCFYCGCQYESVDSMISNCPGVEEEDH